MARIICLVSSYSSDIDVYSDCSRLGNRYVSNRMLISVQICISCTSMYGHWQTLRVESRVVSSICTSRNETREDSHILDQDSCVQILHGQFDHSRVAHEF